jgi:hypothetical protein
VEGFNPIMGLLAFLFVIGLLLLTLWFLKSKTALGGGSGKTDMRVVDTLRIDPKKPGVRSSLWRSTLVTGHQPKRDHTTGFSRSRSCRIRKRTR